MPFPATTLPARRHVVASGTLDAASARQLKADVARAAADAGEAVVLDLADVTEIDGVALGAILALDSNCSAAGRRVEIVPPAEEHARDLLLLLGGSGRLSFRSAGSC